MSNMIEKNNKYYSKYEIATIQEAVSVSEITAMRIIDYMDTNCFYPDWSEASWAELRRHFKQVMNFISTNNVKNNRETDEL